MDAEALADAPVADRAAVDAARDIADAAPDLPFVGVCEMAVAQVVIRTRDRRPTMAAVELDGCKRVSECWPMTGDGGAVVCA